MRKNTYKQNAIIPILQHRALALVVQRCRNDQRGKRGRIPFAPLLFRARIGTGFVVSTSFIMIDLHCTQGVVLRLARTLLSFRRRSIL